MTVETDLDRAQYATNATTGPWTVPFYFLASEELGVTYTDAAGVDHALALNVDYTVVGAGDLAGGTITTIQAYAVGGSITILRDMLLTQETRYVDGDEFPAASHERALDRLTMIVQQLREAVGRAISFPSSFTGNTSVGDLASRAGKLLGFDVVTGAITWITVTADSALGLANSIASTIGSSLMGYIQSGIGAVTQTVQSRLRRFPDVIDYGAASDNSTETYTAVSALVTEHGSNVTLKFPRVKGTANVYKFTTVSNYATFDGTTLDVDEGVTLTFPDDTFLYTTLAKYKVVRPFLFHNNALNTTTWVSNYRNRPLVGKGGALNGGDVDTSILKSLNCTTDLQSRFVAWPGGDTFTDESPSASASDSVTWTNPSTGNFHMSFARVQPGDELSFYPTGVSGASISITAMVRGAGGYGGFFTGPLDTGAGSTLFSKQVSVAATSSSVTNYPGQGTHASYAGARSLWTLRIVSWTSWVLLFNGVQVAQGTIPSGWIEEAGFGLYVNSGTGAVTFQDWVIRRNVADPGVSVPLSITCFGDSITASRYECWPNYMREELEGLLGMRVPVLTNNAVSGATAAQQYTTMQATGLGGGSIIPMLIGTNDIQALTAKATFVATLTSILSYCNSHGGTLVLGVPPLYYTQTQVGNGSGQATTNYEQGAYIRSAVIKFCADNNIRCVDLTQVLGPILANYRNSGLSPYWGADVANDPMVFDNIHPSPVMERLIARAFAKVVAGLIQTAGLRVKPGSLYQAPSNFSDLVLKNSWVFTTERGRWMCDDAGNMECAGIIDKGTGSLTNGTIIMRLPRNLIPRDRKRVQCSTDVVTAPCYLDVSATTGDVSIQGVNASATKIYLDGLAFNVKQQ